jgi:hypothetical protein
MKSKWLVVVLAIGSTLAMASEPRLSCPSSVVSAAESYAESVPEKPSGPNHEDHRPQCFAFTYGYHVSLQYGFGVSGDSHGCELRILVDRSGTVRDRLKLWDHPAGNPYGTEETSKRWSCHLICDAWNNWCGQGPDYPNQ